MGLINFLKYCLVKTNTHFNIFLTNAIDMEEME